MGGMTSTWRRWARNRLIIGLTFLGLSAVAIAVAVVLYTTGHAYISAAVAVIGAASIIHAGFEFWDAAKYAREGARA